MSHQKQYQQALRVIKSRTGASHREAQAVYRTQRAKLGPKIPPEKFANYSQSYLTRLRSTSVREQSRVLFSGKDAAFDLRRLQREGAVVGIEAKDTKILTVKFTAFLEGKSKELTVTRKNVKKADFWRVYHDMSRQAIERFKGRGRRSADALLVNQVTAL